MRFSLSIVSYLRTLLLWNCSVGAVLAAPALSIPAALCALAQHVLFWNQTALRLHIFRLVEWSLKVEVLHLKITTTKNGCSFAIDNTLCVGLKRTMEIIKKKPTLTSLCLFNSYALSRCGRGTMMLESIFSQAKQSFLSSVLFEKIENCSKENRGRVFIFLHHMSSSYKNFRLVIILMALFSWKK